MTLIDVLRKMEQSWNSLPAGQKKIQIQLPASSNGIYQLMIETNKGRTIRKIELMK